MFQYLKLSLEIFARTTILLCKHMKYSNSLILFSFDSLEVLLLTETGSRSNTRSLIIQAHSPLCKQHLINSRYHCKIKNGSVQERVKPHSSQGEKKLFYHRNSGNNPPCLSVPVLVKELQDGALCLTHQEPSGRESPRSSPPCRHPSKSH